MAVRQFSVIVEWDAEDEVDASWPPAVPTTS
jgi:hypothetical protein